MKAPYVRAGTKLGRGCGSKSLTVIQLLASAAFIAGGITMLIISRVEADDGRGELPVIWQTPTTIIRKNNVSPGYILGAVMLFRGAMYLVDTLLAYPEIYVAAAKLCCAHAPTMEGLEERRDKSTRRTRRYVWTALAWAPLMFVMHQSTGVFNEPLLLAVAFMFMASVLYLLQALHITNSDRDEKLRRVESGKSVEEISAGRATQIGLASICSLAFAIFPFIVLWVDYTYNKADPYSFVTDRMGAPLYLFTIGYFIYWTLAVSAANHGITKKQTWFVRFPLMLFDYLGLLTQHIMDGAFVEECVATIYDCVFYGIIAWLIFDDVVQERITIPLDDLTAG